jgi:hypothetical protein
MKVKKQIEEITTYPGTIERDIEETLHNFIKSKFTNNQILKIIKKFAMDEFFLDIRDIDNSALLEYWRDAGLGYDIVIEENTLENFQKMYGANEIKKILKSFYPLNQDSFEFINGEKSVEYYWSELKNEFIYDEIESKLKQFERELGQERKAKLDLENTLKQQKDRYHNAEKQSAILKALSAAGIDEDSHDVLSVFFDRNTKVEEDDTGKLSIITDDGEQSLAVKDYIKRWSETDKAKNYKKAPQFKTVKKYVLRKQNKVVADEFTIKKLLEVFKEEKIKPLLKQ